MPAVCRRPTFDQTCAHWTASCQFEYSRPVLFTNVFSGRQQESRVRDDGQGQQEWQAKHVWLAALASLADLNLKLASCAALTRLSQNSNPKGCALCCWFWRNTFELAQLTRTRPRVHARGTEGALLGWPTAQCLAESDRPSAPTVLCQGVHAFALSWPTARETNLS